MGGLVPCEVDTIKCRFVGYSHKQLDRHIFYCHKKVEPINPSLPEAEKRFIKRGIPIFQNFEGQKVPEGATVHDCPHAGCPYQALDNASVTSHKKIYHQEIDFNKFINESV